MQEHADYIFYYLSSKRRFGSRFIDYVMAHGNVFLHL